MEQDKFSKSLTSFVGYIENPALQDSLSLLFDTLGLDESSLYNWSDSMVALAMEIDVDLPSLGNFDGIDIRTVEPVLIVFDLKNYPWVAPRVYTDRLSFPKDHLAHLYIAKSDKPPAFCLVRGNFDDWYATKRATDLVIRTKNWLRDAATGELTTDNSQFDPMRLEGYSGTFIYDYNSIANIVDNKKSFIEDGNTAIVIFKRIGNGTMQFVKQITLENFNNSKTEILDAFKKEAEKSNTDYFHVGYIVWSRDDKVCKEYLIDMPKDFKNMKSYCNSYGIDLTELESIVFSIDYNIFKGVPLIIAIRRPERVIGFDGIFEFSNHIMIIASDDKTEGKIDDNVPLKFYSHNQPLTHKIAKLISGVSSTNELSLVLGCGALGSKIVMHLARSGQQQLILSDPDVISPHNMTRHALLGDQVGLNKATAIVKSLERIFPDQETGILALNISGLLVIKSLSKPFNWIFDFTTSENVFNTLINESSLTTSKICRANISDMGDLGIMLIEGTERNPRIDDLHVYLISLYDEMPKIGEWLIREYENAGNTVSVNVGVGCNSETTVLADDAISSHAAFFSAVIKRQMKNKFQKGKLFLNRIIDSHNYSIETEVIDVEPFIVMTAVNDSTWNIRYKDGIIEKIITRKNRAGKKETGGLFIGVVNYKNKTIHVTDLIDAPPDSESTAVCFFRGHNGLPEKIQSIREKSGNQLGYIGEWHSHPHGPNGLSETDMDTIRKFKSEFDKEVTPLPVFLTVVTTRYVLPYIF